MENPTTRPLPASENNEVRYDSFRHHRRSIRMNGYDYSWAGAYFVTVCTKWGEHLFGRVLNGEMQLNDAGRMVERWWLELNHKFQMIRTDEYVVMPNHFHGIIEIVGAALRGRPINAGASTTGHPQRGAPTASLGTVMDWFKTMTTNEYIRGVNQRGWQPCAGALWHRNYYERIIRNDDELNRIRQYVVDNPAHWDDDPENLQLVFPMP